MSEATVHIAGWEASGVIDHETADRLRASEAAVTESPEAEPADAGSSLRPRAGASAMFGPGVTVSEVFGYLGGAFLLAAWSAFMARVAGSTQAPEMTIGIMAVIAAAALTGLGIVLRRRDERSSRAAGVAFILVSGYVAGAWISFSAAAGLDWPVNGVVAAGAALASAVVLRTIHPSVLTQAGVLGTITALAGSSLAWLQVQLFPRDLVGDFNGDRSTTDPIVFVVASAAWWLAVAVVIALIGLREARTGERTDDPAATRRAAVSRFWAGLLAVVGLAMAIGRSAPRGDSEYGRVLEPWVGDVAVLVLSAILVERAFRRDATSFIYAAALGLIVALSDFNLSYFSSSTEVALVVEGTILLAVGVGADRLRRLLGRGDGPPVNPVPDVPLPST